MFPSRPQPLIPGDDQAKFIQERITASERQMGEVCQTLLLYARNYARVRDQTDELVQVLTKQAELEEISKSSSAGLNELGKTFSLIADEREIFLKRVEAQVVEPFSSIKSQSREVRDDVKTSMSAKVKEIERRKGVEKLRQRNPRNRQKILMAETDLARASADVSRTLRSLEEQMDSFEALKLNVTRTALQNLVVSEIALHAKEIELLTKAYEDLQNIDEEQDLEEFRKSMKTPTLAKEKKSGFRSIANLFMSKSNLDLSATKGKSNLSKSTGNVSIQQKGKGTKSGSRRSLPDSQVKTFSNSELEDDDDEDGEIEDLTDETNSTDEEDFQATELKSVRGKKSAK